MKSIYCLACALVLAAVTIGASPRESVRSDFDATADQLLTGQSARDIAFRSILTSARKQPLQSDRVLEDVWKFVHDFPNDLGSVLLLRNAAGFDNRSDPPTQQLYGELLNQRIATELAERRHPNPDIFLVVGAERELVVQKRLPAPSLAALRAKIDAVIAATPQVYALRALELGYVELLDMIDPAAMEQHLRLLAKGGPVGLAEIAQQKLELRHSRDHPSQLSFTALDGRQVDFAKLRGKVVLVDFWATWCAPCMAEMPHLKRLYAEYHDLGLEIIGVSFDFPPTSDLPQGWSRLAKTAEQVLEFTRQQKMPWPQHYEGKKNAQSGNTVGRLFAVTEIPAAFLMDKDGVLSSNSKLRGAAIEVEIRRLLELPTKQ